MDWEQLLQDSEALAARVRYLPCLALPVEGITVYKAAQLAAHNLTLWVAGHRTCRVSLWFRGT